VEPLRRLEEGFMAEGWWEREREGRFLGTELVVGNVGGEVARWWKGGGEDIAERSWTVVRDAVVGGFFRSNLAKPDRRRRRPRSEV